jgi:subtilisin family serine protease
MPHYYARSGTRIELDEAPDDIGVRFSDAAGPESARLASRILMKDAAPARAEAPAVRRFGRFVLMHDTGAAAAPVAAVVNAMSARMATRVARTMPVFFERDSGLKVVATDQILVRFRPGATGNARRRLLESLGLAVVRPSEFDPLRQIVTTVSVRRASRALDLANQLAEADDLVEFAAPNFLAEVTKPRVNDPRFGSQWHLRNTGRHGGTPHEDVDAAGAWKLAGGGSARIVIAIIDDGVDLDHPDLAPNIWANPRKGAPDRHGRDFVDDTDRWNPRPKVFNPPFDDTDSNDIHGTPCAGVAAAAGNNRQGVAGIAWRCKLLSVKILAGPTLAPYDRIGDSIRYAARHADVLSCSWGVARHPDVESAIADAIRRGRRGLGAPVFVATGNEFARRIAFPSSDERAFAVGASNDRGVRSRYSNYGRGIAFVAPSDDARRQGITTTDVHLRTKGYAPGSAYCDDFGGTSAATPLAAGIAALMLSVNRSLRWNEVGDLMKSTADRIDTANGNYRKKYSVQYGYGRLNAAAAVAAAAAHRRRSKKKR